MATDAISSSITQTLGAGSGVNFTALVGQLVDAQFANSTAKLTKKNDTLTAQISGVGTLKSGISSFSSALSSLVKGGTLATQPTSSNTNVLKVSSLPGAKLAGLIASVEVKQLASAQSASTAPLADRTAPIGTGSFTLTFGQASVTDGAFDGFTAGAGTPVNITIDSAHSSLDGIAAAINAANAGVTATIVTDSDGARLTLKGRSGASQGFTLTANEDPGAPGLSALDIGVGATGTSVGTAAKDAVVVVDGVSLKRSTNSIKDLIAGVQLDLVNATPGTVVTLGTQSPSSAIIQAVGDFVETFNQFQAVLKEQTDAATGPLHNDTAAQTLSRALSALTLTPLTSGAAAGAPTTLADLGVATNRDGTLTVNSSQLVVVLARDPAAVEALFADGTGLGAAVASISTKAADTVYGLGASATRYSKAQSDLGIDQEKIAAQSDTLRTRLTKQFASTDAKIASYKATQDYLTAQVDAWNAAKN